MTSNSIINLTELFIYADALAENVELYIEYKDQISEKVNSEMIDKLSKSLDSYNRCKKKLNITEEF